MRSLGIDIGGSSIKVALKDGQAVRTARSVAYTRPSRETLIEAFAGAINTLGESVDPSIPVGLCVPGKQSETGDRVVLSLNLPCLNDWGFEDLLRSMLGSIPERHRVVSDIHATAADLGASSASVGRVAVIAIGTGVGFTMMEDGQILSIGSRGVGHLGQLDVGRCGQDDRYDASGARNSLESYVGIRAIRERVGSEDEDVLLSHVRGMCGDDPLLLALVRALRTIHAIHAPDTIILVGGVGIALQPHHDLIVRLVNDWLTPLAVPDWQLLFGESLYYAASGAARLALD